MVIEKYCHKNDNNIILLFLYNKSYNNNKIVTNIYAIYT